MTRVVHTIDLRGFEDYMDALPDAIDMATREAMDLGLDLAVNEAKRRAPQRTGELKNSIDHTRPSGSVIGGTFAAEMTAGAPHASYIEEGTRPHVIRPRFRQALRFPSPGGGGFAFAKSVRHPGTDPDPYMEPAVDDQDFGSLIEDAITLHAARLRG